jgi:hypothetical protein
VLIDRYQIWFKMLPLTMLLSFSIDGVLFEDSIILVIKLSPLF